MRLLIENPQMIPEDEEGYDLELDLDAEVDDDADQAMQEAMAAVEAMERRDAGEADGDVPVQTAAKDRGPSIESVVDSTDSTVREMQLKMVELRERSLRALADLENFRRRSEKEKAEAQRYAGFDLLREVLAVVDNMERALGADGSLDDLKQGVEMIHRQLLDLLKRHNVERIEADGQPFDPGVHEAVASEETAEVTEPTVLQEMQSGFRMHDRLLRPSMVRVAMPLEKAAPSSETADSEPEGE